MKQQPSIWAFGHCPNDYWSMLQSGDRYGLEELYKLYSHDLFKFGLSMVANESFVQDCIQEVFIDLWKYHKTLQKANNVKVYLFKALSRKISKESSKEKKWKKQPLKESNSDDYFIESIETNLVREQTDLDVQERLAKAIHNLPVRQKELIIYLFFENFSYEEVSKIMGINLRSVYTLAWKAISTLKKIAISIGFWSFFSMF